MTFLLSVFCDVHAQGIHVGNYTYTRVVFPFSKPFRPALGIIQPPIQCVLCVLSLLTLGIRGLALKLTTHVYLMPRQKQVELYLNPIHLQDTHRNNFLYMCVRSFIYGFC